MQLSNITLKLPDSSPSRGFWPHPEEGFILGTTGPTDVIGKEDFYFYFKGGKTQDEVPQQTQKNFYFDFDTSVHVFKNSLYDLDTFNNIPICNFDFMSLENYDYDITSKYDTRYQEYLRSFT